MAKEAKTPETKAPTKKVETNPDFTLMINPKGVEVEIHNDRVLELEAQGYKKV